MRPIDADELAKVKFHPLPYTHITPPDLIKSQTEAYERGWNDAIDAIVENAETADVRENVHGEWVETESVYYICSLCGDDSYYESNFCPNCGADMRGAE